MNMILFSITFQSLSESSLISTSVTCGVISTLGTMSRKLTLLADFSSSLDISKDSTDSLISFPRIGFGGTFPCCC